MIIAAIPYCPRDEGSVPGPGLDLGHAINQHFERIRDDDWLLTLDHDLMLTTRDWYRRLERAIEQQPDAGFFTLMRAPASTATLWSQPEGVKRNSTDIVYHRTFGRELAARENGHLEDVTDKNVTAGIFLMKKIVWRAVGGWKNGFKAESIDYDMHRRIRSAGYRIYLIRDVYCHHSKFLG